MMSEMTIGEMPMETSFVGASAAPSQAPAAKPQRTPSSCSFFGRAASWIAGGNWEGETGGIFLRSENQRINRRRSNPPIKTATGTQKWMSVSTLVTQLLPCSRMFIHPVSWFRSQRKILKKRRFVDQKILRAAERRRRRSLADR